jgi:hypothetical protein
MGSQSREFNISQINSGEEEIDGIPNIIIQNEEVTYSEVKKIHLGGSFGEHVFERIKGGSIS